MALSAMVRSWDLIPGPQAVNLSDMGVEINGETGTVWSQRENRERGTHPHHTLNSHSRFSKGLKSWAMAILHLSPSGHITLNWTMSAEVSF